MGSDEATATTTAPANDGNKGGNSSDNGNQDQEPIEYNPRWMGYLCILTFSGINFIFTSNVPKESGHSIWTSNMIFGFPTFLIASIVLIQDRCQSRLGCFKFNYTKCKNGYLEGSLLLFFLIWWIVGVACITRPGGVAYTVSNIYYSAWFTFASCVYTLDKWSESKDILSIDEIISVSFTLRYWWIHFTAAFVVFVSSISLEVQLSNNRAQSLKMSERQDAFFGIVMGLLSLIVSSFFILVHYDFITFLEEGGWSELFLTALLVFVWLIAMSIFTSSGGIASSISGFGCEWGTAESVKIHNCTIVQNGVEMECRIERFMPGSNMYYACWACMLSSIAIGFKWKAAQALKFAESQAERQQKQQNDADVERYDDGDDDDDNPP